MNGLALALMMAAPVDVLVQLGGLFVEDLHAVLLVLEVLDHAAHLRAVPLHLLHHRAALLSALRHSSRAKQSKASESVGTAIEKKFFALTTDYLVQDVFLLVEGGH